MSEIRRVGVIGAGTMGNGIAHVFARSGYDVLLCEVEQRFLDRGMETLRKNLEREAVKGKIGPEAMQSALQRITGVLDRNRLADCDFVIEAATEKFETKKVIFVDLDYEACQCNQPSGLCDWNALFQSRANDEAGGSDSRHGHFAGDVQSSEGPGDQTGKDAGGSERCAGFCIQSRADAAFE